MHCRENSIAKFDAFMIISKRLCLNTTFDKEKKYRNIVLMDLAKCLDENFFKNLNILIKMFDNKRISFTFNQNT